MTKISALAPALAMVFALGLATAANAEDTIPGTWKVAVGSESCNVTLEAGSVPDYGTVTPAQDCTNGIERIAHWQSNFRGVQFLSASGELLATMKPQGESYEGKQVADGRDVELSRTQIGSAR
jgi:Protease inhibitor Inh